LTTLEDILFLATATMLGAIIVTAVVAEKRNSGPAQALNQSEHSGDKGQGEPSGDAATHRLWRRAEVFGLWAAAAVGLIAVLVASHDAREQIVALRGQLSAMLADQRAWLDVTITPTSLEFDSGSAVLGYRYKIKNVGRSVAENVEIYADAVAVDEHMMLPATFEKQADGCDATIKKKETLADKSSSLHLFPNDIYPSDDPNEWAQSFVVISPDEIKRGVALMSDSSSARSSSSAANSPSSHPLNLNLIGCIYYRLSAGDDFHQTGFVFNVYRTKGENNLPFRLEEGKNVEFPQLRFIRQSGDGKID
jgi:hypothetical protein